MLQRMLTQYYAHILTHKDDISIQARLIYKAKDDDDVEHLSVGYRSKLKKVQVEVQEEAGCTHFLLYDRVTWETSDDTERMAGICFALDSIEVISSTSGKVKVKAKKPDIVEYASNMRRFGASSPALQEVLALSGSRLTASASEFESSLAKQGGKTEATAPPPAAKPAPAAPGKPSRSIVAAPSPNRVTGVQAPAKPTPVVRSGSVVRSAPAATSVASKPVAPAPVLPSVAPAAEPSDDESVPVLPSAAPGVQPEIDVEDDSTNGESAPEASTAPATEDVETVTIPESSDADDAETEEEPPVPPAKPVNLAQPVRPANSITTRVARVPNLPTNPHVR